MNNDLEVARPQRLPLTLFFVCLIPGRTSLPRNRFLSWRDEKRARQKTLGWETMVELELLPLTNAFRKCGCNSVVSFASFTVSE